MKISSENNLFLISNVLKKVINYLDNSDFVTNLPESFFAVLSGELAAVRLRNDDESAEIQLLLIFLRLTGGLDLSLIKIDANLYLFNFANCFQQYITEKPYITYPEFKKSYIKKTLDEIKKTTETSGIKEKILWMKPGNLNHQINSDLQTLVILTHNRPEDLDQALAEFIGNLNFFGHQPVNIIISDDSEAKFAEKNQQIIEKYQKYYPAILHLDLIKRQLLIEQLISTVKDCMPNYDPEKLSFYLYYLFGGQAFKATVGRNRNFISFYLKDSAFISIDDDCRPRVLTYHTDVYRSVIYRMLAKGDYDLRKINNYIIPEERRRTQFLAVDFLGYFYRENPDFLHYSRYTGVEDSDLFSFVLNSLNKSKLELKVCAYLEKTLSPKLQGLCCYFPKDFARYRMTLPDRLRVEDTYFGYNFLLETKFYPIHAGIALYHDKKTLVETISPNDLHLEIIVMIFYKLYDHMIIQHLDGVTDLFNYISRTNIIIYEGFWNEYYAESEKVLLSLKKEFDNALKNNQQKTAVYLERTINGLTAEFFSLNKKDYQQKLEGLINRTMKNYLNGLELWDSISKSKFKGT